MLAVMARLHLKMGNEDECEHLQHRVNAEPSHQCERSIPTLTPPLHASASPTLFLEKLRPCQCLFLISLFQHITPHSAPPLPSPPLPPLTPSFALVMVFPTEAPTLPVARDGLVWCAGSHDAAGLVGNASRRHAPLSYGCVLSPEAGESPRRLKPQLAFPSPLPFLPLPFSPHPLRFCAALP